MSSGATAEAAGSFRVRPPAHLRRRRTGTRSREANTASAAARAKLTHDLVVRPNVSVIDMREILQAVRKVFGVVTVAIDVVGTLVIVTGGLILIGAVAVTKFQRVYEAAIFKTLGANSRMIAAMLMVEYGLLGRSPAPSVHLAHWRSGGESVGTRSTFHGARPA